jgi:IS1 family transposase
LSTFMNNLPLAKRAQILGLLVEGNSLRATSRLADCSINTVTKLLVDVGTVCAEYQDKTLRNLKCKRIQCDEIWSFVYAKAKNADPDMKAAGQAGDVWTWTAIDADTKLIASWMIGDRSGETARIFVADLAQRLTNRVQLTTDGHRAYLDAVEGSFDKDIDYAVLVKIYGENKGSAAAPERRYRPAECCGTIKGAVCAVPRMTNTSPRAS